MSEKQRLLAQPVGGVQRRGVRRGLDVGSAGRGSAAPQGTFLQTRGPEGRSPQFWAHVASVEPRFQTCSLAGEGLDPSRRVNVPGTMPKGSRFGMCPGQHFHKVAVVPNSEDQHPSSEGIGVEDNMSSRGIISKNKRCR